MAKFVAPYHQSGLTVNFRFQRDSDGYFWNNSTEEWGASAVDVEGSWDSDMEYYYIAISHADFIAESFRYRVKSTSGIRIGDGAFAPEVGTIARYVITGTQVVKSGVD